jgi:CBS domain containing-hemolysin-like protein
MTEALQLLLAPLALVGFTLWAAWLALAAEAEVDLPRQTSIADLAQELPLARRLHVAHLSLLVLAGASAATATVWWVWPPAGGGMRLLLAVLLVWCIGDLLPRLLAAIAPELARVVRPTAGPTLRIFTPLFRLVSWAERKSAAPAAPVKRTAEPGARDMLVGVFSLADMSVAEVMTPRIDIVAVDVSAEREEVIATLRSSEHARLLVFDDHPDAVVGVVYAKDMLAGLEDERPAAEAWRALIRPAAFVPEGKSLGRQLRDFQRGPSHLAVVVDEFGGTAGIITLEDILEQIVGEIQDEYDTDEVAPIQPAGSDAFRVQGGVALTELEALLGHAFGRDDVSTVGGLVLAELGHVPRAGETILADGIELQVEHVARRRVRRVLVRRVAPAWVPSQRPEHPE